jgi:hypothetical protein
MPVSTSPAAALRRDADRSHAAADVGVNVGGAAVRHERLKRRQVGGDRPLGDQVDDARRRREAVIERADALQHLDPFLVLERQVDEIDYRQRTVEAIAGAVFHQNAADRDIVVGRAVQLRSADARGIAQRLE